MCRRAVCPNDGKPTWYGCGKHIEQALDGVPPEERCDCEHEPVGWYMPGFYEVKKREGGGAGASKPEGEL